MNTLPLGHAVSLPRRFFRGDKASAAQLLTYRARGGGPVLAHAPPDVGDRAFGDC